MRSLKKKKCSYCSKEFEPFKSTTKVCSMLCAINLTRKIEVDEKINVMKEKLKTLGEYEKEARKFFQMWIRKRDEGLPCISCPQTNAKQWDGGHFYKAEVYSGMIFNEDNCHRQCSQCNDYHSGNLLAYREGLINRYGLEFVERLEQQKDNVRNYRYTKTELTEIKNKYKKLLKAAK